MAAMKGKYIMAKRETTEETTEMKKPRSSRTKDLLSFLEELMSDESHAGTVKVILSKMTELGFGSKSRQNILDSLGKDVQTFCKITFLAGLDEIDGIDEEVLKKVAEIAAEREMDPETTKLRRIVSKLGVEATMQIWDAWVMEAAKRVAARRAS